MVQINIKVNLNGADSSLQRKGSTIKSRASQFARDLVNIAQKWVQREAPRKTGRLKSSIQKTLTSFGGSIFQSTNIAPYGNYVIDGTKAHTITAKSGHYLYWKGASHPVKKVKHPGTKSNPFIDKAITSMDGEINSKIAVFEQWLTEV